MSKLGEDKKKEAAAAAAAEAKAAAKAAAAVAAAADRIGDTLFVYTWEEQVKRPLWQELEEERSRNDIPQDDWERRLVILNKHGVDVTKEIQARNDGSKLQEQFYMTVVLKAPVTAAPTITR